MSRTLRQYRWMHMRLYRSWSFNSDVASTRKDKYKYSKFKWSETQVLYSMHILPNQHEVYCYQTRRAVSNIKCKGNAGHCYCGYIHPLQVTNRYTVQLSQFHRKAYMATSTKPSSTSTSTSTNYYSSTFKVIDFCANQKLVDRKGSRKPHHPRLCLNRVNLLYGTRSRYLNHISLIFIENGVNLWRR